MLTVGVDLATQPAKTAIARIAWSAGSAEVVDLCIPATDADIRRLAASAHAVGIDAPFGWPDAFIDFVVQHRDDRQQAVIDDADEWRRGLANRVTDRVVAMSLRKWPLSVSTDRIALTAMRAASLLASWRDAGEPVDRAGGGRVAEVYPAAALQVWGLRSSGYKQANVEERASLVDALMERAPWLQFGAAEALCRRNDDAFDAVIASLIARAHALGRWHRPDAQQAATAAREGWIVVPDCPLDDLVEG